MVVRFTLFIIFIFRLLRRNFLYLYILNANLIDTMKKLFLLVVLLISMGTGIWAQFPKAIFPGDYPDPSILRDGKDYYMTHSPFLLCSRIAYLAFH